MKINLTMNGKEIESTEEANIDIHMDFGSGKDFSVDYEAICLKGQVFILNHHVNPHLDN